MSTKVVSTSMPLELIEGIDSIARYLSVSRSAVISAVLFERVPMYSRMCDGLPPLERDGPMRFMGASQGEIVRLLGELSVGRGVTQRDLFEK